MEGQAGARGQQVRGHGHVHETDVRERRAHDEGRGHNVGGGVQTLAGHETVVQAEPDDGRAAGHGGAVGGDDGPGLPGTGGRRAARPVRGNANRGGRVAGVPAGPVVRAGQPRVLLEAVRRLQAVRGRGDHGRARPGHRGGRVADRLRAGRADGARQPAAHRPDPAGADAQLFRVPVPGVRPAPARPRPGQGGVRGRRGRDRRHRGPRVRRVHAHPATHPRQPDHMGPGERRPAVRGRGRRAVDDRCPGGTCGNGQRTAATAAATAVVVTCCHNIISI